MRSIANTKKEMTIASTATALYKLCVDEQSSSQQQS